MPDEVKSARLTADWENKLLEVEHGNLSADSFMNEINRFVTELVSKYGSVDDSVFLAKISQISGIVRSAANRLSRASMAGTVPHDAE